jgi:hypothetical protein
MNRFYTLIFITISINSYAQPNWNCKYIDPNILIINCGLEDRYKLSETVVKMRNLKAKVIAMDFIFFDTKPMDSIFIEQMTGETPIILTQGNGNDSAYFNIANCHNGPHAINGNEKDRIEFLFPFVKHNEKLRDSFELLVLKYFDAAKYERLKNYLIPFYLSHFEAKAKIEFNGNSLSCFHSIDINDLEDLDEAFIEDKIVIFGYFGTNPDIPLDKDKDRYAFKVRSTKGRKTNYMYSTVISANIISNLIRKEIRESDLSRIK